MIKGVLFDKDGTLLDFNRTWLGPYRQAANYISAYMAQPELGQSLMRAGGFIAESESWRSDSLLASGSNAQILDFWSGEIGQPIAGDHLSRIKTIFARAANHHVPALDDLPGFLQGLTAQGMVLGVATMDDEENVRGMLASLQLTEYFDFVCGADSGHGVKPEAGMVHAFCSACALSPGNVMMVGDSPKDLHMGRNAGVAYCVGVLTGAHGRGELAQYGDYVFDNISGLQRLLETESPIADG